MRRRGINRKHKSRTAPSRDYGRTGGGDNQQVTGTMHISVHDFLKCKDTNF